MESKQSTVSHRVLIQYVDSFLLQARAPMKNNHDKQAKSFQDTSSCHAKNKQH